MPKFKPIPANKKATSLEKLKQEYALLDRAILKLKALRFQLESIDNNEPIEMLLARDLNRYAVLEEQEETDLMDF